MICKFCFNLNVFDVQMFGFLLYVTEYNAKEDDNGRILSIPKVEFSVAFKFKLMINYMKN